MAERRLTAGAGEIERAVAGDRNQVQHSDPGCGAARGVSGAETGMNWGRGLLRLWLLATVLWLLVIGAFAVEPAQTFWTFWSVERPHLLGPEEIGIKPQGPKPPDDLVLVDPLGVRSSGRWQDSPLADPSADADVKRLAVLERKAGNFDEARRLEKLGLQVEAFRRRESAKNSLLQMTGVAVGPPFAAFIFGATMLWVIRGFRPSQSTRT